MSAAPSTSAHVFEDPLDLLRIGQVGLDATHLEILGLG